MPPSVLPTPQSTLSPARCCHQSHPQPHQLQVQTAAAGTQPARWVLHASSPQPCAELAAALAAADLAAAAAVAGPCCVYCCPWLQEHLRHLAACSAACAAAFVLAGHSLVHLQHHQTQQHLQWPPAAADNNTPTELHNHMLFADVSAASKLGWTTCHCRPLGTQAATNVCPVLCTWLRCLSY